MKTFLAVLLALPLCAEALSTAVSQAVVSRYPTYIEAVLQDDPFSYWRLNEQGGTTAYDYMGRHDGTYTGTVTLGQDGPLISGSGSAVDFVGSGDLVSVADHADWNVTNYTLEVWIRPDDATNTRRTIMGQNGATFVNMNLENFELERWDSYYVLSGIKKGSDFTINTWQHTAVTRDIVNDIGYWYRDGVSLGSQAATGNNISAVAGALAIGAQGSGAQPILGQASEAVFYKHALSIAQLAAHRLAAQGNLAPGDYIAP